MMTYDDTEIRTYGNSQMMPAPPGIRDADLLQQLDGLQGAPGYRLVCENLVRQQEQRDAEAAMSPLARRRKQLGRQIARTKPTDEDRHHIHSVLALCGLPYRRPADSARDFIREYGRNSLVVQAGYLKDPMTGRMEPQGLPYGPKARLLLLHICTMAMRQGSPELEIADSMSAFIRDLGFDVTGGKRGTIRQFKEQLNRLAAARMQMGFWRDDTTSTINTQPIERLDVWLPTHADQRVLWSSTLKLDQTFYDSLRKHALPVDLRTLKAFSQSAKQIDIVLWLAYRLRSVRKTYLISWKACHDQFGAAVEQPRKFKQSFARDFALIKEVFPKLPAKLTDKGLLLDRCDPEDLFVPTKRARLR